MRFFRHRLAVASLIILIVAALVAIFANGVAPYGYDEQDYSVILQGPTLSGWHLFGTDELGRDYLSRVIFGLRTSLWVAFFVAGVATVLGTIVGSSLRLLRRKDRQPAHAVRRPPSRRPVPRRPARPLGVSRPGQAVPRSGSSLRSSSGWTSHVSSAARSSRSARRSSSRPRRRPGRAICESCSGTCCRAASGRSSSR